MLVLEDESKILKLKKRNEGKMFVKCSVSTKAQKPQPEVRIGVLGASGYTGSEVASSSLELMYSLLEEICLLSNGQSRHFGMMRHQNRKFTNYVL